MKKILAVLATAAVLVACEKNGTDQKPEDPNTVTYAGVTYKTVTLADGQTWMAENLRFVPEGMTVSENPTEGDIWYPYSIDGKTTTAIKDAKAIEELGYLYNYYTALKLDKKKIDELVAAKDEKAILDYLKGFEGTQGICPDGWHLPTVKELTNLVGQRIGVRDTRYPEADRPEVINEKASFYDATYKIGKVMNANNVGFNITFPGLVNKTSFTGKGIYLPAAIAGGEGKCSVAEWVGKPAMNGFIGSTVYLPSTKFNNIQFWGAQTTFAKNYPDGGMQVNFTNIGSGYSVRCVKNK